MERIRKIKFDYFIFFLILPIIYFSHFLILEYSDLLAQKQIIYIVVGFIIFFVVFFIPIRHLTWLIPYIYWLSIIALILVFFIGSSKLGAQRWIEIPIIHLSIQPSEFIKPSLILMLAYIIKQNPPPKDGYRLRDFAHISFYILLPFLLILKQPDLGTASILITIGYAIIFIVGIHWRLLVSLIVFLIVFIPLFYMNFMQDYQKKRIHEFMSKEPSYHVRQSIIAIGNGGIYGNTKDKSSQVKYKFLPIASSDFIFAYISERFGFIGALGLIIIYFLLIIHIFHIQHLESKDIFLKVFSVGFSSMIFIYVNINIAMVMGLFPVVGVPLPLMSYGGSSFITFMILFAILENLLAFRFVFMYNLNSKNKGS